MAAIIFISIGVIASFFCAIVDGIIASEFIVSNRTHLQPGWGGWEGSNQTDQTGWSQCLASRDGKMFGWLNVWTGMKTLVSQVAHTKNLREVYIFLLNLMYQDNILQLVFTVTILHIYLVFLVIFSLRRIRQSSGFRGLAQLQIPDSVCKEWKEKVALRLDSWFILFCHEV